MILKRRQTTKRKNVQKMKINDKQATEPSAMSVFEK